MLNVVELAFDESAVVCLTLDAYYVYYTVYVLFIIVSLSQDLAELLAKY